MVLDTQTQILMMHNKYFTKWTIFKLWNAILNQVVWINNYNLFAFLIHVLDIIFSLFFE